MGYLLFWLYEWVFTLLITPLLILYQLFLVILGKGTCCDLGERLGINKIPEKKSSVRLLFHAVSAGEAASLEPLLILLSSEFEDCSILISTNTQAGKDIATQIQSRLSNITAVFYIPWDSSFLLTGWIRRLKVDLVGVIETEIWPGLFHVCQSHNLPLTIINGRIDPSAATRYRWFRFFFRYVFEQVTWIGVQNRDEKIRFQEAGAVDSVIEVVGNLKFDLRPGRSTAPFPRSIPNGTELVLIGGSLHHGEEELVLNALIRLRKNKGEKAKLILAPRNILRSDRIVEQARERGLKSVLYSKLENPGFDVLVIDTYGLLNTLYSRADLAIVGGSFVSKGGHSFIEAVAQCCPVIVGPFTENFDNDLKDFIQARAVCQVSDNTQMVEELENLVDNPDLGREMANRASRILQMKQGAATRYATKLIRMLEVEKLGRIDS